MRLVWLALLACAACEPKEHCRAWGGSTGRSSFFQCGDSNERVIECDLVAFRTTQKTTCTCSVGGVPGNTFESTEIASLDTRDGAIAAANARCGWHMTK